MYQKQSTAATVDENESWSDDKGSWLLWTWINQAAVRLRPNSWKSRRDLFTETQRWNLKSRSDCQLDHIREDPLQENAKNTKMEDMLSTEIGAKLVRAGRAVGTPQVSTELDSGEDDRTVPFLAFDYAFLTREGSDTFPIGVARDSKFGIAVATCCASKGPPRIRSDFPRRHAERLALSWDLEMRH